MLFKLVNDQRSNNCFVNVVVQNFWHLNGFAFAMKDTILESSRLRPQNGVLYQLSRLLKKIKESNEFELHTVAELKNAILTEMYGADGFDWNEQADACEAFQLILKKYHEYFKGDKLECDCSLHGACQLNLCKRTICRWPNCQGVRNEQMDSDLFYQLCYMRQWFEFVAE